MTVTSYTTYVGRLHDLYSAILKESGSVETAHIDIVIYRNGFGYKAVHRVAGGHVERESFKGEITSSNWTIAPESEVNSEIDRFFALEEFYAYSDKAFNGGKGPFSTAHWDATLAHVTFSYSRSGRSTLVQRMLFVAFTDDIHAEFSLAIDQNVLVQDHSSGRRYFEWKVADGVVNADVPGSRVTAPSDARRAEALAC